MSSAVGCNSSIPDEESKLSVGVENTRHKRRRRGKKRKFHRSEKSVNESDISEMNANQVSDTDENQALEKDASNANKRRPRGILIRPINVPKAPKNSTQFIIDDHKGCGLYFSFETPNPYYKGEYVGTGTNAVDLCEKAEDAAFQDIDYTYVSPQNFDDEAYIMQDFEDAYSTSRYEELMLLSKKDLLETVANLETRLEELEEDLVKYDPSTVIEQLQQKLLSLQEENAILTGLNSSLKAMFSVESNESASEQSLEEELSENETECILQTKEVYAENVESTSEPSVDCNLPENEDNLGSNVESVSEPSIDGNLPENEDILGSNIESVSEPSVDGNIGGNEDILNVPPGEEQNMGVCVEESREHLQECSSLENEKIEYNSMSEKMSNVEIAESAGEHVNL